MDDGTVLSNRYMIRKELGAGGMGAVYEATDLRTGGLVAVKTLHPLYARDTQFVNRLRREAQIAASIRSPRAVKVIDLDEHQGTPYLVMEHVTGENLSDVLEREGRLPVNRALDIMIDITRALEGAHAVGVVHRDLKPQNVKITEDGEIKVLDFGIARAESQPGITATNVFTGTPEYCAPERLDGLGDIRSDIYSLGVMLYEMVEGRRPFSALTAFALLRQHEIAPVPPLTTPVPPAVRTIVDRALAKKPEHRFQTPAELLTALRGAREGRVSPAGTQPAVLAPAEPEASPGRAATVLQSGLAASVAGVPASGQTVPRAPDQVGPTPLPGDKGWSNTRLYAIAGGAILALAAAGGALYALTSGREKAPATPSASMQAANPTGIASATAAATLVASATAQVAPTPPPLMQPGDAVAVNASQDYAFTAGIDTCPGATSSVTIRPRLTVTSIQRDAAIPGRMTVTYTRNVPVVANARCTIGYQADTPGNLIKLETLQPVAGENRVYQRTVVDGTGLSIEGSPNIYGRDAEGTWVFDGVQFNGTEMTLVQTQPDGVVIYRLKLLPLSR